MYCNSNCLLLTKVIWNDIKKFKSLISDRASILITINIIFDRKLGKLLWKYLHLQYDVSVMQWITSCHNKKSMTTREIALWRVHVKSLTTFVSTKCLLIEMMFVLRQ